MYLFFFLAIGPPPSSTLFPYTTLFRSIFAGGNFNRGQSDDSPLHPPRIPTLRSEEHTSELQSHSDLVCRLLLEKKKPQQRQHYRRKSMHNASQPSST